MEARAVLRASRASPPFGRRFKLIMEARTALRASRASPPGGVEVVAGARLSVGRGYVRRRHPAPRAVLRPHSPLSTSYYLSNSAQGGRRRYCAPRYGGGLGDTRGRVGEGGLTCGGGGTCGWEAFLFLVRKQRHTPKFSVPSTSEKNRSAKRPSAKVVAAAK